MLFFSSFCEQVRGSDVSCLLFLRLFTRLLFESCLVTDAVAFSLLSLLLLRPDLFLLSYSSMSSSASSTRVSVTTVFLTLSLLVSLHGSSRYGMSATVALEQSEAGVLRPDSDIGSSWRLEEFLMPLMDISSEWDIRTELPGSITKSHELSGVSRYTRGLTGRWWGLMSDTAPLIRLMLPPRPWLSTSCDLLSDLKL